jgi:hypothetical protein
MGPYFLPPMIFSFERFRAIPAVFPNGRFGREVNVRAGWANWTPPCSRSKATARCQHIWENSRRNP